MQAIEPSWHVTDDRSVPGESEDFLITEKSAGSIAQLTRTSTLASTRFSTTSHVAGQATTRVGLSPSS
jgi:hypothetical protein